METAPDIAARRLVNHTRLSEGATLTPGVDVTLDTVSLGTRVQRGRHWNNQKWRDDIDKRSAATPKPRVGGTILGYTDAASELVGENTPRSHYRTDRITAQNGPGWAVVRWDTGLWSTYPIGAENLFSLKHREP